MMTTDSVAILGVLFGIIALSELLVRKSVLKHLGTALLVILLTAIVANAGLIPSASNAPPLYDVIFTFVAPISIFFLLLDARLAAIRKAGLPLLLLFLLGSSGTVVGAIIGGMIINGNDVIGTSFAPLAGMFTGTYSGGSINFNAVALHYDLQKEGNLYAGAVAIDNIITALWMVVTMALPRMVHSLHKKNSEITASSREEVDSFELESVNPMSIGILMMLGLFTLWASDWLAGYFASKGISVPSILILTTISLVLAQWPRIHGLAGSRVLGIVGIYLFLAIIGAYCEFATLPAMGMLAVHILVFASILVGVHGLFIFGVGRLLKQDWDLIAISSQANVGGSGSALALAKSLNRSDLLLPSILLGTLGNALGTYLGFLVTGIFLQ